jgi:hypothetical protein
MISIDLCFLLRSVEFDLWPKIDSLNISIQTLDFFLKNNGDSPANTRSSRTTNTE